MEIKKEKKIALDKEHIVLYEGEKDLPLVERLFSAEGYGIDALDYSKILQYFEYGDNQKLREWLEIFENSPDFEYVNSLIIIAEPSNKITHDISRVGKLRSTILDMEGFLEEAGSSRQVVPLGCPPFQHEANAFLTWEDAKIKYPNRWVLFKSPQYGDAFHTRLLGGEFVLTAGDHDELFDSLPEVSDSEAAFTARHTWEDLIE